MPVADTSSIVDILRRDPRAIRLYETCEEEGTSLFATVVTAMELYKGAYASTDSRNVEKVRRYS
ncbi:MAG: hypothetical protein LUP97_04350 [Methanoregula sp.]|nr:hypothetical protein [Methanoregula sp.]